MRYLLSGNALCGLLFLAACGGPPIVAAEFGCADPAPLHGQKSVEAPGYMVVFHEHVEVQPTTWTLAEKYDFTPSSVSDLGFSADFPDSTLDALRCEEVVRYVEHLVEPAPPPVTS